MGQNLSYLVRMPKYGHIVFCSSNFDEIYIHVFRRLLSISRAPQIVVLSMLRSFSKIGPQIDQIWRGCPAGTGGHPDSGTPSKVRSRALVCCSTAISKSCFTNNQGGPPPP